MEEEIEQAATYLKSLLNRGLWNKAGLNEEEAWILGAACTSEEALSERIRQRLWFTYRTNFAEIGSSGLSSDRGWGCMLRCSQMVVAECLVRLRLGATFSWRPDGLRDPTYDRLVSSFLDAEQFPFSIHQIAMMSHTKNPDRPIGSWCGPNAVAHVIKSLAAKDELCGFRVHVAMDNLLVMEHVNTVNDKWMPLLLFIPLRLGLDNVNDAYFPDLKSCFRIPYCVGLMGGKPNQALFMLGYQGDQLLCLDPHLTQEAVVSPEQLPVEEATFHTDNAYRIGINDMDPSLAVCFFCPLERDFADLCRLLRRDCIDDHQWPMFEILQSAPPAAQTEPDSGPGSSADTENEDKFELV